MNSYTSRPTHCHNAEHHLIAGGMLGVRRGLVMNWGRWQRQPPSRRCLVKPRNLLYVTATSTA